MCVRVDCSMGRDRVRYLVFLNGRWRWHPSKAMRAAGFRLVNLSKGEWVDGRPEPSLEDKKEALRLCADWDRHRRGLPPAGVEAHRYPPRSVGDGYERAMAIRAQERRNRDIVWTREQESRDDWPRAWKWIEPMLGDCDPRTVTPEQLIGDARHPERLALRPMVARKVSESEAHRVIKVWRALWQRMAAFGYCDKDLDPSFAFANAAPQPRQAIWLEGEAVRLVKQAWRDGYHGLAALLAVAWDSQLSPVDARSLRREQMRQDPVGTWFRVDRAKTGRGAIATLSRRTLRLLVAYLDRQAGQPARLTDRADIGRIFRNRSGRSYSKDTLGDDFRALRATVFGPAETRQLADFRRSGTVEAFTGDASAEKVSAKMANSLSESTRLQNTYAPVQLAAVRDADAARRRGRTKLRGQIGERNPKEIPTAPAQDSNNTVQGPTKSLK
jgi:hypothetical protein